jgi:hypothetical protein
MLAVVGCVNPFLQDEYNSFCSRRREEQMAKVKADERALRAAKDAKFSDSQQQSLVKIRWASCGQTMMELKYCDIHIRLEDILAKRGLDEYYSPVGKFASVRVCMRL